MRTIGEEGRRGKGEVGMRVGGLMRNLFFRLFIIEVNTTCN